MSIRGTTFAANENTKKMRTFILGWNPSESTYSLVDFQRDFPDMEYGEFEWEIRDREQARSGDNFYLVKWGPGSCGIVMRGFFLGDPFPVREKTPEGQDRYFIRLRPQFMVHPDHPKGLLTVRRLKEAMPDFPWDSPAGQQLPDRYVPLLKSLWDGYETLFDNADLDGMLADRNRRPEAGVDEAVSLAVEAHYGRRDHDGNPPIVHSLRVGMHGETDDEIICGILHEVLRYPEWTAGDLRDRGFSEEVVDVLLLVLHRDGMDSRPVRFDGNRTAAAVATYDAEDNFNRLYRGETSEWPADRRREEETEELRKLLSKKE